MLKDQDIKLGALSILFGAAMLTQANKLSGTAGLFPKWLLYLVIVAGILIVIKAVFAARRSGEPYHRMNLRAFFLEAGLPGGALLVLCLLLNVLGFYLCSFLVISSISIIQEYVLTGSWKLSKKTVMNLFLFSAGTTVIMYLCFSFLLSLPTPRGVMGF